MLDTKRCPTCKKIKSKSEFYKWSTRYDGIRQYCKDCDRIRYRNRRMAHIDVHNKKDKNYYLKHREEIIKKRKENYQRDKHKISARSMLRSAVKRGIIVKDPCKVCGSEKSQGHHGDYSKPLDVIWLCAKHHRWVDLRK